MKHCVIDMNTIIGHVLWEDSIPNRAVDAAFRHLEVLRSEHTSYALKNLLLSARFDKYISQESRKKFLDLYEQLTVPVNILEQQKLCSDINHNIVLELALNGRPTYVITSQRPLLEKKGTLKEIKIVTPLDFLESIS